MNTLENTLRGKPGTGPLADSEIAEDFVLGPFMECRHKPEQATPIIEHLLEKASKFYEKVGFTLLSKPGGQTLGAARGTHIASVAMSFYHNNNTIRVTVLHI